MCVRVRARARVLGDSRISSASTSSDTIANISANSIAAESDSFQLTADSTTEFSVWVSFCEIYRENIHDLLETQVTRAHTHTHTHTSTHRMRGVMVMGCGCGYYDHVMRSVVFT